VSVVLSEHLPLLASAPGGIQKLRGLILELAVRGKLVPQDPDDEPENRKVGVFSDFFSLEYGDNLPAPKRTGTGEYPVYGSNGVVGTHDECRVKAPCIVVGRKGSAGALNLCRENGCWVTDVAYYCIPPSSIDLDFAFVLFHTLGLDKLGKGIKPGLSRNEAYSLPVAIPPLAEQHRIVAKVDELMALCDLLEAEQADAASAHTRLVEALLGTLTQSTDATDLAANWQRLAEHFDSLFTTEASIDALKQTVLKLAVMGKLVPQALHDEPASELLKKIAQERTRLEMAGICKKSKAMSVVGKDEHPFEVPDGWTWVLFDEIINPQKPISYGVLVPGPEVADGVPFVRIADLSITAPPALPEKKIDRKVDAQYSRTRLDGGEILMGVVGSIGKLGLAPRSWKGANIARAICRIVPTEHVDKLFVLQLLQSKFMQSSFVGDTRTLAQPTLNVGLIRSALTPVPPLAEQKRIVAKVDELMALCDHIKADLATARQQQATLADTLIDAALEAA